MFYPETQQIMENATENSTQKLTVPDGCITPAELEANESKTWRQLRLAELLQKHSFKADLIVV